MENTGQTQVICPYPKQMEGWIEGKSVSDQPRPNHMGRYIWNGRGMVSKVLELL